MTAARELSGTGKVFFWTFRALWTSVVVIVPTIGVWVGSSIAAYLNGPVWAVCLAGLLLFPGLPLGWDWLARRKKVRKRWHAESLTWWDRIVLRTLFVNFVFLGVLLWRTPETAFTALSTRGDWIVDGIQHPIAERVRPWFFHAADGLEWLYEAAHDNEYEDLVDDDALPEDDPKPRPREDDFDPWKHVWKRDVPDESDETTPETDESKEPAPLEPGAWPQPATLHPLIASLPDQAKTSPEAVGAYIRENEADPHQRVKAIHDFVADHVAYDAVALAEGRYPPQDAETVFRTGLGVCAGYANLAKEIADASGDHVIVIVGDSRERGGGIAGGGHAWNAARIENEWYLFDATWDAGYVHGREFEKKYQTGYLFTPPTVMGITHFPQNAAWQLREEPIGRGEFVRQPMMRPRFFAQGFSLEYPMRSQVTVDHDFEMRLGNPAKMHVLATYSTSAGTEGTRCEVGEGTKLKIDCAFPADGTYHVSLFSSDERYGEYDFLGEVEVNAKG
jgi:hypothetical protein